jgi:hypothetical protein
MNNSYNGSSTVTAQAGGTVTVTNQQTVAVCKKTTCSI